MFLTIQTVVRKLKRSLSQRGLTATLLRFLTKPLEFLGSRLRDYSPRHRQCRRADAEFDRRLNIDTAVHLDSGWMAKINSHNWVHGIGYAPVPIAKARSILADLQIDYAKYVFIDYGAGKGRVLFLASEHPFPKIIGVEYSPDLFQTLQKNLQTYRNPVQHCQQIDGVLQDAAEFPLPLEPLVLFFHHPFDAPVFHQVIDRVERSLLESPRDIRVIYYDPICGELFERGGYFHCLQQGKRDPRVRYSSDWKVYGSCIDGRVPNNSRSPECTSVPEATVASR